MKTISFRDIVWPSDLFMVVDDILSDAFDGIELTNCICQELKLIPIRVCKNTFITGGSLGYMCFNRPSGMTPFIADMMKVVVKGTTMNRIEAGIDVFLEVGCDNDGSMSYIDEIEVCGRASINSVHCNRIRIERNGIAGIYKTAEVNDTIVVYGTAVIGTEKAGKILLQPGGRVLFLSHDETYYHIECVEGREPFKTIDNYICG